MAHEVLSVAQMAALDRLAPQHGVPIAALMERAGLAVAEAVARRRADRAVLVACGPGANGGDGIVAARILRSNGVPVTLALLDGAVPRHPAAAAALQAWGDQWTPLTPDAVNADDLLIDALFGAGLTRPLAGASAALTLQRFAQVVAVDLPSGLHGDGGPPDGPAMRADATVTFVRKKPAHVLEPGRELCGDLVVADIGMPELLIEALQAQVWDNHPNLWASLLPRPARTTHKHARGRAMVLSGPAHATGAARLAATAALRVGAGLVSVLSPPSAVLVNASHLTAVMVVPVRTSEAFARAIGEAQAVVLGPGAGVGPVLTERVQIAASNPASMVLDADALTVFQEDPKALFTLLRRGDVLTPHAGEFRRLFPDLAGGRLSKLQRTREAAARCGCTVLLKGPDTVIACPSGRAVINTRGTPYLATAGSGDVLAGAIAGLVAQGMPGWEAACAGAWLHGRAGELLGPGLIAEDLPAALPKAIAPLL